LLAEQLRCLLQLGAVSPNGPEVELRAGYWVRLDDGSAKDLARAERIGRRRDSRCHEGNESTVRCVQRVVEVGEAGLGNQLARVAAGPDLMPETLRPPVVNQRHTSS
jgi:hypothetical protein